MLLAQAVAPTVFGVVVWGIVLFVAIRFYWGPIRQLLRGEGAVASLPFGIPDVLVLVVSGMWMVAALVAAFQRGVGEEGPITIRGISQSTLLFAIIVGGLSWFMESRKISVSAMFGWRKIGTGRALLQGLLYLVCAYPLVLFCMFITSLLLKEKATPQKLIEFFHSAVSAGDYPSIAITVVSAAIVAPFVEEFVFRGYVYGVLRRFLGPWTGLVVTSVLFAVVHFNALSFPSLLVLAVCLTLAYEASGSLLVPIVMHALFNFVNLIQIFNLASR